MHIYGSFLRDIRVLLLPLRELRKALKCARKLRIAQVLWLRFLIDLVDTQRCTFRVAWLLSTWPEQVYLTYREISVLVSADLLS